MMYALFELARGRANLFARFLIVFLLIGLSLLFAQASAARPLARTPGFLEQRVIPDDGMGDDGFGYAAISGTIAMVGEAHATINGRNARGEVYVYGKFGKQWVLTQKLYADDGAADDEFGLSIAMEDDTAIIGARGVNNSRGAVYIFTNSDGTWTQMQKLTASNGETGADFGWALDFDQWTTLVTAPFSQVNGNTEGAGYFYTKLPASY